MKRDKVLELAREAGFNWPEISTTTIEERLERFAALIEAEVCGGAEPDYWFGYGLQAYPEKPFEGATPVYLRPATAVMRQLVDALRMVLDDPDSLDGRPRTYECVQEALAAAKQEEL